MKEPVSLPDIQLSKDTRDITLQHAGVSGVEVPLLFRTKSGELRTIPISARMSVQLCKTFKGVHMSRFVTLLTEWSREHVLDLDLSDLLEKTTQQLHSTGASLEFTFRYFVDKAAPVTRISAPTAIPCTLSASSRTVDDRLELRHVLTVEVPVATLCPCSKAISKYGAHNQRTVIRATLVLEKNSLRDLYIEDIVSSLEGCASSPVYPVLKRVDEKHVTEHQYDNPKFVEDVLRDAILLLRDYPGVNGFALEIESLESIHAHNAWASHQENFSSHQWQ